MLPCCEESTEPTISLKQLKKGRSDGKMLLKSGPHEIGKKDGGAEQLTHSREWGN